ncbi:DUF58 domain-containing protein [bacterium]|nr:DUF58 domain-containing protein [bacterium]MDB4419387.1 DUF58 domain-containing protein [bacterium]MDB4540206.1 DUF58 domain-containing protein [bacterium]MDB4770665.1 DUF58 domain-containing protein [bacterium]
MNDPFNLLDPDFLQQASAMRVVARRVAPAGRWAEHRSRDRGQGMEFRDYRPYSPGDELKSIDWNVYRRLGRFVVRLFEEMEDLPIYLMPDLSKSMWHDEPPRAITAMKVAVAFASIGLDQHDRVGVLPFGEDLDSTIRPTSGRGRLGLIAESLSRAAEKSRDKPGGTDLATALSKLRGLRMREGLLVIISDFFDPHGIEVMTAELKRTRHRPLLVSISRKEDREPELQGDIRVRDCETGDMQDVSITNNVIDQYRIAYDAHFEKLEGFAKSRQGNLLFLDHEGDVMKQLAQLFEGGSYVA